MTDSPGEPADTKILVLALTLTDTQADSHAHTHTHAGTLSGSRGCVCALVWWCWQPAAVVVVVVVLVVRAIEWKMLLQTFNTASQAEMKLALTQTRNWNAHSATRHEYRCRCKRTSRCGCSEASTVACAPTRKYHHLLAFHSAFSHAKHNHIEYHW